MFFAGAWENVTLYLYTLTEPSLATLGRNLLVNCCSLLGNIHKLSQSMLLKSKTHDPVDATTCNYFGDLLTYLVFSPRPGDGSELNLLVKIILVLHQVPKKG